MFPLSKGWTHNYNLRLSIGIIKDSYWNVTAAPLTDPATVIVLERGDGKRVKAERDASGIWQIDADLSLKLEAEATGWVVHDIKANAWEHYDANGMLLSIGYLSGQQLTMTQTLFGDKYRLTKVTDAFNRSLQLAYSITGLLTSVTLPDGRQIGYSYGALERLATVTYPDTTTRQYVYDEATLAPSSNAYLLTGIVDEKSARFATFGYNSQDKAITTEHANGVERYTLNGLQVTDPLGTLRSYTTATASNSTYIDTVQEPGLSATDYDYDVAGNVIQRTKRGITTTYIYDLTRNLETSRTEAYGTPLARTITTQWHPTFRLPVQIDEPGRQTTYTYDSFGNTLTKTISSGSESRTWTYTYTTSGLLESATQPSGEVTSYTYDTSGNLATMTDAAGHVTSYANYNAHGKVGLITYPNGKVVTLTYDSRDRLIEQRETVANPVLPAPSDTAGTVSEWPQWLVDFIEFWCDLLGVSSPFTGTTTVAYGPYPAMTFANGDAVTTYVYDAVGQLTEVHLPDGETITYVYDDAHRLTGMTDNYSNTITYTLDAMGNRTAIESRDAGNVLRQKTTQVFDALSRLKQVLGNNGQVTTYTYDTDGHVINTADALNRNQGASYDALGRQASQIDAGSGVTSYTYDALDQLLTVTDPRNNTTTYVPNAFGEVTEVHSPDTGTTTRVYSQGRLISETNARNITTSYTYDNAGRVTERDVGGTDSTFSYDAGTYGANRLIKVTDESGVTEYTYNSQGQVVEKLVGMKDGLPLRVRYSYTLGGKPRQIVTPGRTLVEYSYDAQGRLSSVSVNGAPLLSQVAWGVQGVMGWTWAAGGYRSDIFDLDGRTTSLASGNALNRSYSYDVADRITGISDTLAGVNDTYGYNVRDHLTSQQQSSGTTSYTYDALGNRLSKQSGSATTSYTIASSSSRLTQVQDTATHAYQYLLTGQITSDGSKTFSYNNEGRLFEVTGGTATQTNTYNALGQRVKKAGASTTYFVYDEAGHLLGEYQANGAMVREYVWLGNQPVGMLSSQMPGVVLQVHTDHLGSPRGVSNGSTVLWRWDGEAFGNNLPNDDVDGDSQTLIQPLRFPGQYFDAETQFHYNYYRDYDPGTGRYIQSDPIGLEGGLNTYAYADLDPIQKIDPYGLAAAPAAGAAGAMVACMRISACRAAVIAAIKACKDVRCKLTRHKAHHQFPGLGYCEHMQLVCYVKGGGQLFRAQFPLPGRCSPNRSPGEWLPDGGRRIPHDEMPFGE